MSECDKCDGCGSAKTYGNQALLPINGRVLVIKQADEVSK